MVETGAVNIQREKSSGGLSWIISSFYLTIDQVYQWMRMREEECFQQVEA